MAPLRVRLLPPVLRPLRDPALALLWGGLATSAIGDQLFSVALAWIAVQALGTAAGYLNALQAATILAVALLAGRWADRRDHRRVMIAADLFRAATLLAVIAEWSLHGVPAAWSLVLAVLALAGGSALFRPALQAMLPATVGDPAKLPAANALLDTTDRIARLLGPGIVGVLGTLLPLVHFVTLDAATFTASAAAVAGIGRLRRAAPRAAPARETMLAAVARGFAAMRRHRVLGYALLTAPVLSGTWNATMFFGLPLLIAGAGRHGSAGLAAYGLVIACYGSTNLLTTLVVGGWRMPLHPALRVFGADALYGAGILGMGIAALSLPAAWVLPGMCAAAAIGAINGPLADIPLAVLRQTRLAPGDQAAAMRAILVATNLGTLVALAAAPSALQAIGVAPAFVLAGLACIASGLLGALLHHDAID